MAADGSNTRSLTASLDRSDRRCRRGRLTAAASTCSTTTRRTRKSRACRSTVASKPSRKGSGGGSLDRPYTGGQFSVANNGAIAFTSRFADRPNEISIARGGRVRQLTHLNDGLLSGKTLGEVKPLKVTSSFDQAGHRRVDRDAAELRSQQEVSADSGNPRRAVRRVRATLLDRLPAVRSGRLRGALHESARLDLVRPRVREPHPSQLPEPGLRRPDERRRCSDRGRLRRWRQPVRHGRLRRRRTDCVDRRQDDALQSSGDAEAGDQLGEHGADDGRRAVHAEVLVRQAAVGRPGCLLEAFAAVAGRRSEDADARAGGRSGLPHAAQRLRAVLPGAATRGRADGIDQGAGRIARRPDGAAVAIRGESECDPGVVRALSRQRPAKTTPTL